MRAGSLQTQAYRSIFAAIASTSEAAALVGDLVNNGICARMLSLTLVSWRITPARGGVNFRKFVQALASVSYVFLPAAALSAMFTTIWMF